MQYRQGAFDRRIGNKIDANSNSTYESATYWAYDDAEKRDSHTGTAQDDIVLEFTDANGDGAGSVTGASVTGVTGAMHSWPLQEPAMQNPAVFFYGNGPLDFMHEA